MGRKEVTGFLYRMLAKNIEELIKLYNTYFATTNAITDTSKNHLSIDANTIR